MKTKHEIEKELNLVQSSLNTIHKNDHRHHIWRGYRDALLWVLTTPTPLTDRETLSQFKPISSQKRLK